LFGPPFLGYALWRGLTGQLFAASTILQAGGNAATLILMFSGFHAILIPIVLALHGRGLQRLYCTLPLLPFYYCLVSLAAWAALIDLAWRPYHWSKTEHGPANAANRASPDIRD
jgi:glycosyltransferase XagB